jgi:hypothetical protein
MPLHIFGPATTNSSSSLGRCFTDRNSCKTEKPQIQSIQTLNANTADRLIKAATRLQNAILHISGFLLSQDSGTYLKYTLRILFAEQNKVVTTSHKT